MLEDITGGYDDDLETGIQKAWLKNKIQEDFRKN